MTARRSIALALAAMALFAPRPAAPADILGRLSLLYQRDDSWTAGRHATAPRLDLEGGLDAAASPFGPGIVDWSGGAQYQRLRASYFDSGSTSSSVWTYRSTAALLRNPVSPVSVSANASRTISDSTYEGATSFTGRLLTDSYGVDGYYNDRTRPVIRFGANAIETTRRGFEQFEANTSSKLLRLGTTSGAGTFSYGVDYRGAWNSGTFATDNYDDHLVDLRVKVVVDPRFEVFLEERYNRRLATLEAQTNPEIENSATAVGVHWRDGGKLTARTRYSYDHFLAAAPGSLDVERLAQTLSQAIDYTRSREWWYSANVALAFAQNRSGTAESRLTSETAGVLGRWTRTSPERELLLSGGPTVGLIQPEAGGPDAAYGATGLGRIGWLWPGSNAGLAYGVTYGTNTNAALGSSLSQSVTADASTVLLGEMRLRSLFTVAVDRRDLEPIGATATRSILLTSDLFWRRRTLSLQAGISSGFAGSTPGAVNGDGLFLPARFNAHNRFASLMLSLPVARPLTLVLRTNYVYMTAPDRPDERQAGAYALLQYFVGAFVLSLEDSYVIGGTSAFDRRDNRLFVRVTRVFGARL
jgi:hypothetical protein